MKWGYGDTELGVKYRFIHETDSVPQVGLFPIVELPSGDSEKGLGERRVRFLVPIWLQKSFGPWTAYGGGGYWHNPGPDNKNFWQTGLVVMRELSKTISVGAEVFNFTARAQGEKSETGFNVGTVTISYFRRVEISQVPTKTLLICMLLINSLSALMRRRSKA